MPENIEDWILAELEIWNIYWLSCMWHEQSSAICGMPEENFNNVFYNMLFINSL